MTTTVPENKLNSSQSLPETSSGKLNVWQKQVDVEDDNDRVDHGDDHEDANNLHDDIYANENFSSFQNTSFLRSTLQRRTLILILQLSE